MAELTDLDPVLVCLRVQALYRDAKWIMITVWICFGLFHTMRSALTIFGAIYIFRESKYWIHGSSINMSTNRSRALLFY